LPKVNSKSYGDTKKISFTTIAKLKNSGVQLCVTEGFAEKAVNENVAVQKIPVRSISLPDGQRTAYACLMSTVPAML